MQSTSTSEYLNWKIPSGLVNVRGVVCAGNGIDSPQRQSAINVFIGPASHSLWIRCTRNARRMWRLMSSSRLNLRGHLRHSVAAFRRGVLPVSEDSCHRQSISGFDRRALCIGYFEVSVLRFLQSGATCSFHLLIPLNDTSKKSGAKNSKAALGRRATPTV